MSVQVKLKVSFNVFIFNEPREERAEAAGTALEPLTFSHQNRKRSRSISVSSDSHSEMEVIIFELDEATQQIRFLDEKQKQALERFYDKNRDAQSKLIAGGRDIEEVTSDKTLFQIRWSYEGLTDDAISVLNKVTLPQNIFELQEAFANIDIAPALPAVPRAQSPRATLSIGHRA